MGISTLAHGCLFINKIKLSHCKHITMIGISDLAMNCRCLSVIFVIGCGLVLTRDVLSDLRRGRPRLVIYD